LPNKLKTLASKIFSEPEQRQFAELSGDFNPIHMDPLYARRTQVGVPVVHGVHILLWALDSLMAHRASLPRIEKLAARFLKPLPVGEKARLVLKEDANDSSRAEVLLGNLVLSDIRLSFHGSSGEDQANIRCAAESAPTTPRVLTLDQIAGQLGSIGPVSPPGAIRAAFPAATRALGVNRIAGLLTTSRLIGMECPGLHSLLFELSLLFDGTQSDAHHLSYRVIKTDLRFRSVRLEVSGCGMHGTVDAFARTPPIEQPSMQHIAGLIGRNEFADQQALIVGGSRGLGEVTAKIIAAGGGSPVITYLVGHGEAERVCAEIREWGGSARTLQYDARRAPEVQIASLVQAPSYLYYFATSHIFRTKSELYETKVMHDFTGIYLDGFYRLCKALARKAKQKVSIFYPSTVAIDEPLRDLTEYVMAKAAGEILCAQMQRYFPQVRITVERLPRVITDQTATVAIVESHAAVDVMLPIIRRMHATERSSSSDEVKR
jgi:acyl dehydratase